MINNKCFQKDWILNLRQSRFPKTAPQLIEKTIYAFEMLGLVTQSGKDFVFKGGTSLMLSIPDFDRFSIDIDIIGQFSESELNQRIRNSVFLRVEENVRKASDIPKQHFKFTYTSIFGKEESVLLDVLNEKVPYKILKSVQIQTDLFEVVENLNVQIPVIDEILGDKLTAFAPHTIGIQYGIDKDTEIIKQLFDIGRLFDHISDINLLIDAYQTISRQENLYRNNRFSSSEILKDTFQAGIKLCNIDLKGFVEDDETIALRNGIKTVGGYLFRGRLPFETAKIYAAKASLLANIILINQKDFDIQQLLYSPVKMQHFEDKMLPEEFGRLQRLKKINPECFYYLYQLSTLLIR
ncbi:MAG TPA: hypothetical protein DHW42_10135 [Candidatus Marinimicrobia bacterium]|nr:hypothetical protein [Candidatus Neomarinimicrobiota bacterium]